jgi:microsomal dipeptidase-like Zn-dependent dipeptidase
MGSIDRQLDAAVAFQAFLDKESGGVGKGWFRIVTSPSAARDVIRAGKLAVVLGIEVDNLFNCKEKAGCTAAGVQAKVDAYYKRGVRHIFPIHNFDNGFGGAAAWQDAINVANAVTEGRYWEVENCRKEGYGYWLNTLLERGMLEGLPLESRPKDPPEYVDGEKQSYATCNRHGLKPLGETLIESLMDHGMLIDVDHMSKRSVDDTIRLAKKRRYPLVAGHVQFFEAHRQSFGGSAGRHERMRTGNDLDAIREGGGLVAVMTKDDQQDGGVKGEKPLSFGGIPNTCNNSTRTFAQTYLFAASKMKGPVAFGSDFTGFAGHVGPRFGNEACGGSAPERNGQLREKKRLEYPFVIKGFGTFQKQVSGQKTFDFNVDGLAHIGLYPDMIADLKRIGVTDKQLEPLFRSAEAYIEVWERAEKAMKKK